MNRDSSQKNLLIFGGGDVAELAAYYFAVDFGREVQAFVLDDEFVTAPVFAGKPLVALSECTSLFDPDQHDLFVALAYTKLNHLRREKLEWAKREGFGLTSYISPRISIFDNVSVGANCFILEDNTIQPFVTIGENVTLWSGNHIGHHSTIEDDVFIASHVVVSGGVTIGRGSFIGVNATLRDHISIGELSVIGAGTVILGDTERESVYSSSSTKPRSISSSALGKI